MPIFLKAILCIIFPPFLFIWVFNSIIKPAGSFAKKESTAFSKLVNNPCTENALEYSEIMRNRPSVIFAETNHPDAWAVLREKWQIINHSNKVPTNLKKEIFDILADKGLYVRNSKIIDNYNNSDK